MANDFQTHAVQVNSSIISTFVPDGITSINTSAQVVIHAVYVTNQSSTNDTTFDLILSDGANTIISYILKDIELPRSSTISVEKPINLPQSTTPTVTRKLRIKADSQNIHATASVLVITV